MSLYVVQEQNVLFVDQETLQSSKAGSIGGTITAAGAIATNIFLLTEHGNVVLKLEKDGNSRQIQLPPDVNAKELHCHQNKVYLLGNDRILCLDTLASVTHQLEVFQGPAVLEEFLPVGNGFIVRGSSTLFYFTPTSGFVEVDISKRVIEGNLIALKNDVVGIRCSGELLEIGSDGIARISSVDAKIVCERQQASQWRCWTGKQPTLPFSGITPQGNVCKLDSFVLPDRSCFWFPKSSASPLLECGICFCEFEGEDAVTLDCGHAFHEACLGQCLLMCEKFMEKGQRIVFSMAKCPGGCGTLIRHKIFTKSAVIADRYRRMLSDAKERGAAEYPHLSDTDKMDKYLYYVCDKCKDPYWGGSKDCAAMMNEPECDPTLLLCDQCHNDFRCSLHDRQFVIYKCSLCCNPANHFSFGQVRLCENCFTSKNKEERECVAGGCPLGGKHQKPAFPIGCLLCLSSSQLNFDLITAPVAEKETKEE